MEEEAFRREILNQVNSLVNSNEYTPDIPEVGTGLNEVIAYEPKYLTDESGQRYQEALRNWKDEPKPKSSSHLRRDVCMYMMTKQPPFNSHLHSCMIAKRIGKRTEN